MATFGSSIINKSGKRFAPKAAPRRSAGASQTTTHSSRGSIERRTPSITSTPAREETGSTEIQELSLHAARDTLNDSDLGNAPSKASTRAQFINSQPSKSDSTLSLSKDRTRKDHSHTTHSQIPSDGSRNTQDSDLRPLPTDTHPSDDPVSVSTPARRSSRIRKETPSTDLQQSPRKRQRSESLATSQTEATRENSLGSHQLTDVPAQYQNDSLRASRNGPKSSNRSGRNGRVGSEAGPKTLHGSSAISEATANNAEPQSRQIPKAKDTKESKQQNSSTASAKDGSKGKKKAKLSAEIGQSQFAVDIQQVPGNGIGASAEPENEDDLENAGAKRRRRRAKTPENSETIEIATSIVKMSELCKDLRTGKKSKRAEEIEKLDWTEVVRKQRERRAHREAGELPQQETEDDMLHQVREEAEVALQLQQGPQMRVVNGQMVVDDASLQVDRHAAAAKSAETFEEIEESELTRRVNSGTWLKREKTEIWSHDDISLLYQGLRMFGTDFEIIAKMFPLRSRRQIKLRYNKEERIDPVRIKQALSGKTTEMNLEEYSRLTDATYEDPAIFNAEMERKRQEHELEQNRLDEEREEEARKKREDNERSVEPEEDEGNEGSQKENDVMAANIVSAAVGKQKKTKRKAKKPAVGKVDKKSQHSRKIAGEAEVLGPVEEV